jgi:hypothetical protein
MRKTLAPFLIALAACAPSPSTEDAAPPVATPPLAGPVLPFIHDDYDAALAVARERDLPIFVDSWAPW